MQRRRTSSAHATVRKQVAMQTEASRSEGQKAQLDKLQTARRLGEYDILDELGRGGMGVVFKAFHRHLKRVIALKVIIPNEQKQATLSKRFRREVELHARLSHPNIVHIHDYGVIDDMQYFAMDFVTGTPLSSLIGSPEFTLKRRVTVLEQIADALDHAHKNEVVHRDIKPDNIIVDAGWQAHLVDFGIAKPTKAAGEENITRRGFAVGTPHYMAPEQFRPTLGETGPLSDVYSLGAVAYHTLAGRMPFEANSAHEVLMKASVDEAEPLDGVPTVSGEVIDADLAAVIRLAMRKSPEQRYQSSRAFSDDLARCISGDEVMARPLPARKRWLRRLRKNQVHLRNFSAVATGLFLLSSGFIGSILWMKWSLQAHVEELATLDGVPLETLDLMKSDVSDLIGATEITGVIVGVATTACIVGGLYRTLTKGSGSEAPNLSTPETRPAEIGSTASEI